MHLISNSHSRLTGYPNCYSSVLQFKLNLFNSTKPSLRKQQTFGDVTKVVHLSGKALVASQMSVVFFSYAKPGVFFLRKHYRKIFKKIGVFKCSFVVSFFFSVLVFYLLSVLSLVKGTGSRLSACSLIKLLLSNLLLILSVNNPTLIYLSDLRVYFFDNIMT